MDIYKSLWDCLPTAKQLHNLAQGRGTPRTLGQGRKKTSTPKGQGFQGVRDRQL